VVEIIPLLSVYSAPSRYIFPIKRLITGKVYPDSGHSEESVRTKPSPVSQHRGSVRSLSKNFLDWTGRFRTGLIHCWTGRIIGPNHIPSSNIVYNPALYSALHLQTALFQRAAAFNALCICCIRPTGDTTVYGTG
jgi:hypothetical protein